MAQITPAVPKCWCLWRWRNPSLLEDSGNYPRDVKRDVTNVRLLTGTYYLQENRAKLIDGASADLWLLYSALSKYIALIGECSALIHFRQSHLSEMESVFLGKISPQLVFINDRIVFTQLVLGCTSEAIRSRVVLSAQDFHQVESISKRSSFALHLRRCNIISKPI